MSLILLAEDDTSLRFVLSQALGKEGFNVRATTSAATLAKWVREGEGELVLTDAYLGEECVFDVLPGMRMARPNLPVIVMSAQSTVATALSAAGAGAYDYIAKPFDLDALIAAVRRALPGVPDARARADAHRAEKEERLVLIGRSSAMQEAFRTIARVASSELSVLIEGETGAGKRRVARALHEAGRRAGAPFVVCGLAGADAARVERELLGEDGKLARAKGGSLLLADIDALAGEGQARLSGVLGAGASGVRLIASAQQNVAALVEDGAFRQDLFYRLNVVTIRLPPLRERADDIADMARAFVVRARREGLPEKILDASAIAALEAHDWPGNARELENLIKRVLALSPSSTISARDISGALATPQLRRRDLTLDAFTEALSQRFKSEFDIARPGLPNEGLYERVITEVEKPLIEQALAATRGNQIRAAAVLGINRNTLRKKIQSLGILTGRVD